MPNNPGEQVLHKFNNMQTLFFYYAIFNYWNNSDMLEFYLLYFTCKRGFIWTCIGLVMANHSRERR